MIICSWCNCVIEVNIINPTSHGICSDCYKTEIDSLNGNNETRKPEASINR